MVKILERSKDNVLGVEATGEVSLEDLKKVEVVFDEAIKKYDKINWLYIIGTMKYTNLRAMYEDMSWLMKNLKHFDRMAVVGDKKWEELMIKTDGFFFGEKYFDITQLEEAWKYVEGKA